MVLMLSFLLCVRAPEKCTFDACESEQVSDAQLRNIVIYLLYHIFWVLNIFKFVDTLKVLKQYHDQWSVMRI